ncbi:hypothetical protein [Haloarcula litorea]|uniref:hypothetical protein n=1 Tax=Haloarcula litorea TaxID=3032579 RepID=UPI0023E8C2B3|nr:hypothetical protein [Halomicroarcula sp. GDY20]
MATRVFAAFLGLVLVASVAAGPLGIGAADGPTAEPAADVSLVSAPTETVTLERGRFGSGRYHLDAAPAVVDVGTVSGDPMVRYVVDVPGLWLTATTRRDLSDGEGRRSLSVSPVTVSPHRVDQRRYDAIVAVWVREGSRDRAVLQRRVTVVVER